MEVLGENMNAMFAPFYFFGKYFISIFFQKYFLKNIFGENICSRNVLWNILKKILRQKYIFKNIFGESENIFGANIFGDNSFGKNIFGDIIFGKNIFDSPLLTAHSPLPNVQPPPVLTPLISDFWSWVWRNETKDLRTGRSTQWLFLLLY